MGQAYTERKRVTFASTQRVHAPREEIFPLLCPVREYDWIPEWECRMVYSASGLAERGCIFQTEQTRDGGLDTWVISHYEPPHRIGFVRVNSLRVIDYEVRLHANDEDSTSLEWVQVITALNDGGDRHVERLREQDFAGIVEKMETLLEAYLARGPES